MSTSLDYGYQKARRDDLRDAGACKDCKAAIVQDHPSGKPYARCRGCRRKNADRIAWIRENAEPVHA